MKRLGGSLVGVLVSAAMSLPSMSSRVEPAAAVPVLEFTVVPEATAGGSRRLERIAGRVTGARPGQRIVLFAKSGIWWVQPFTDRPFTAIARDSTWTSTIHLGTEYAALLVDPDYAPPPTIESLPDRSGAIKAITTVEGSGAFKSPRLETLRFSGYDWEVRQTPSDRGGGNDFDARNAWIDDEGALHLALSDRDGKWTSAEVKLTRTLGYGTYAFRIRDTSMLDPAVALGMLTWDDLGPGENHRELDVEIGRWGDPGNKDAQYVVQPEYVAANVFRFLAPAGRLTHSFRWQPGRVLFKTSRGNVAGGRGSVVAQREFTSRVPVPGAETVHINLIYYRRSPSPPRSHAEVVIEKFEYLP